VLIHIVTQKGKGYAPAEASADKYHGVVKFDTATGKQQEIVSTTPSFTSVFAKALLAEVEIDNKIIAITAAMPSGTVRTEERSGTTVFGVLRLNVPGDEPGRLFFEVALFPSEPAWINGCCLKATKLLPDSTPELCSQTPTIRDETVIDPL
jgi:hypothetical protein